MYISIEVIAAIFGVCCLYLLCKWDDKRGAERLLKRIRGKRD